MVAPAIAAAAAPVVIDSATSEDGLINKLFKIAVLVGFLLLAVFGFFILNFVISISEIVGGAVNFVSIASSPAARSLPLVGPIITVGTVLFSAFGFGGRNN